MSKPSRSVHRVRDALSLRGVDFTVRELPTSTRTAKEAAQAVGCQVEQIAKSLVFRAKESNQALLVIASGTHRVSEAKLAALAGEPIERATAEWVREKTGFAIGGIPPVGHAHRLKTWIDPALMQFDLIWAAAGTPNAVFQLDPRVLEPLTGGHLADVAED